MNKSEILDRLNFVAQKLEANNMHTTVVSTKSEAVEAVKSMLEIGDTITMGGSQSIVEAGIYDMLKTGDEKGEYVFYDRTAPGITPEQKEEIYRKAFSCDAYLSSSNAITENGELYNVDGNGNRVAAMIFGPGKLIVVAGYNKIVKDLEEAVARIKNTATPRNCERLNIDSYCRIKGECVSLKDNNHAMCDGCRSDKRICCDYVVMSYQRYKNRVNVILVAEELGY